ncbi:3'-5' exonuclease [Sphingomonas olei]|jgi:DNA polymerase-3 subunit epsilon|uniref:DNA polymerase III subunit epsilon n=1 Tax=Sphingomonas olei TaxID=1886787 RepID=A0ABY2QDU2_9SPHN|nr:3'-5' exonuclease [Sphingomonas olei]THG37251.1 DNA polymerase III subunit epsilon [Sphingomonas olei]
MRDWLPEDLEEAACLLEAHPAYRVLRALPPPDRLPLATPRGKVRTAVVLDVETTSLDWRSGHIIELAACPVRFDPYGQIVGVGQTRDWVEHPGYPLPAEIVRLTGLTDADLAGRFIDDGAVLALLGAADVLVAHNAQFDSNWIEHRYPALAGKAWCCSMREIDWANHGCDTRTLGGLLAERCGWFNTRHRADSDVNALVALLGHKLPTGRSGFAEMLLTASRPTVRVTATRAPFEVKDALKGRGYRWNQRARAWSIEIAQGSLDDELSWLRAEARCPHPTTMPVTWFERHRQQGG